MTDEQEQALEELCGLRLKAAREELNIPLTDISKELHLDEAKIEALERNEFSMLGAPVFAKGHLRKYAQLVKVDTDQILLDFHQLTRADGLPPVVSSRTRPSMPKSPMPWIVAGGVILLAVAAWFGWQFYAAQKSAASTAPPVTNAAPAMVALPQDESPTIELDEAVDVEAPEQQSAVASELPAEDGGAATSDRLTIQLAFNGDCWTEVTDAKGDRLFFNLGSSGDVIDMQGQAPVSVLLGNANNVSIVVNGRDYSIDGGDRNGETARFTLYGS